MTRQIAENNISKTVVREGNLGTKKGWCFEVYYDGRSYPNFISSLVRTKIGAERNLKKYLKTGAFSFYGNGE